MRTKTYNNKLQTLNEWKLLLPKGNSSVTFSVTAIPYGDLSISCPNLFKNFPANDTT